MAHSTSPSAKTKERAADKVFYLTFVPTELGPDEVDVLGQKRRGGEVFKVKATEAHKILALGWPLYDMGGARVFAKSGWPKDIRDLIEKEK